MGFVLKLILTGIGVIVAVWVLPGIALTGPPDTDVQFLTIGLTALGLALVGSIVGLAESPMFAVTIGAVRIGGQPVAVVVNSLLLWAADWATGHLAVRYDVDGFWSVVLGGLIVSFFQALIVESYE